MARSIKQHTVTIANGASLSGGKDLQSQSLVAVITPSGWTSAILTFQASADGTTYYNVLSSTGAEYATSAVAASSWVNVSPDVFNGIRYVKVRSGTAAAPTAQAGGDDVLLVATALPTSRA